MSAPRVKRPFAGASSDPSQRQITSFFSPRAAGDSTSVAAEDVRSPVLPASVQANLMNVGMRIRKSVPEGYKVDGTSGFKLWTDNTIPSSTAKRPTLYKSTQRELLPFCGLNKVGGLDTQPEIRLDDDAAYADDDVPGLDEIPELTMSQESANSAASGPSRKRTFLDEDDDNDALSSVQRWVFDDADGGVSPRTLTPASWGNSRVMAVPRSRAARKAGLKQDVGQENMMVDDDFEEAPFLVFGKDSEMDMTG